MSLWRRRGEGVWPWLAAGSVALSLLALLALLVLLGSRGLAHFWPAPVEVVTLESGERFAGQWVRQEHVAGDPQADALYRTGNRDLDGSYWRWVDIETIDSRQRPEDVLVMEREHWGEFLGRLVAIRESDAAAPLTLDNDEAWQALNARLERVEALREQRRQLSDEVVEPVARRLVALRNTGEVDPTQRAELIERWETARQRRAELDAALERDTLILESVEGRRLEQPLAGVLAVWRPNAMSWVDKLLHWARGVGTFLSEGPRAGNLEGGVWPAIFGTVMMVLLMSLIVTPFGVLAAIYLNEVARQGPLIRLVRIAVRNLAGVPSIVYGVFGLGVFVYGIGGQLDSWFFSERLPSPTFGTGGLLWASLTLALLTLPVVIVATEEGLARIPVQQREGALALGATRYEMLRRVVLPMAVPAMLTGVILAVARAAGEVAPLMLVGVARLAPQLPLDGEFPFLHLDNKFMHLGYHIYNIGFQGGDVERALPLVYATALLLVVVIVVLNLTAIFLRHHLRARHRALNR
ncbi:phosphate ABC transporter permease PstA [Halomonas sp. McH1-25]|uniref:phosphate ABC transporter permease PstA n=1 Tax=unclassified Halomonas TaxID=2609666 RepID=UPI001EF5024F|nr:MULTISPECIES: phosphate ABC transporter permease PstA [unclassified Halomonas]MCG7599669.1 phosphate ABC transporter permease PstA [Halomonas sp. McH1-25]MCP1344743.1 phosphate ABC transporter permease PstA [Halomonas sp. FL8]MCP1363206.1 phosphate ABC transporter permease PstA [Halomonas sp. BBD45]